VVATEGVRIAFLTTANVGDSGWRDLYSDLNILWESSREAPVGVARLEPPPEAVIGVSSVVSGLAENRFGDVVIEELLR